MTSNASTLALWNAALRAPGKEVPSTFPIGLHSVPIFNYPCNGGEERLGRAEEESKFKINKSQSANKRLGGSSVFG